MTDEAIMALVKKGQLDLISKLYERYYQQVYGYLVQLSKNKETAKDLTQNTFLRIIKYHNSYQPEKKFSHWIFQIARNMFYDYVKAKQKHENEEELEVNIMDWYEDAYELKEEKEKLLYAALSKMNREEREVIVLSKFQKYKYQDIGKVLNCNENAVKIKVFRAIKKLKEYYLEMEQLSYGN